MNDDLLDDLIIILQDSPLFQSWICMLNDWVTSCFPSKKPASETCLDA